MIGAIGAGNFAKMSLMPVLVKTPAVLRTIASRGGVSAAHLGRKFGFAQTTTDYHAVLSDPQVNAVIITTRHNTHASMTIEALSAGKHVFVEKPLALNADELHRVRAAYGAARNLQLMVGFNRRFSLHIDKVRQLVGGRAEPLCMVMTINAGFAAPDSWVHDPAVGGGRIIGEGCHWIDLMSFIAGSPVTAVQATMVGAWPGAGTPEDKMTIDLSMADGSIGTLHYFANGDKSFPKERLEVFWQKAVLQLDNFRRLVGFGVRGFRKFRTSRVDKGHRAEIEAFVDRVAKGGPPLIPFEQLENATRASFAAVESARTGKRIEIAGQA